MGKKIISSILQPRTLQISGILSARGLEAPDSQFCTVFTPTPIAFAKDVCVRFAFTLAALIVTRIVPLLPICCGLTAICE